MTPTILGHLMRKVLLIMVVSWLFSEMAMAEQVIYQWRDANNVLHVSQVPPANVDYQTIVLGTKTSNPTPPAKPTLANKASADDQQSCLKAKENLRMLQQDLPIYIDLEDGRRELLDDSKREQQLQLAEQQIKFYCSEAVPVKD